MKENIQEELRKAREEYKKLKEELAEVQYEANKSGREYSSLFESFAPYNRQILAVKKSSLTMTEQTRDGKPFFVGNRNLKLPGYNTVRLEEAFSGHIEKLGAVVPLSYIGEKSIGVVICISDDDLVETAVEALKNIPFIFSVYIMASESMNCRKMLDMCAEVPYIKHIELLAASDNELSCVKAMKLFREQILNQTYIAVMDMSDKSSAIRSMVNDLASNLEHVQKVLKVLSSGSASLFVASAAERVTKLDGHTCSYPFSAFYWLNVGSVEEAFDSIFDDNVDTRLHGQLLIKCLYSRGGRVAVGSFNNQVVEYDLYGNDFSEIRISTRERLKGLVKEKNNIILDASCLIRVCEIDDKQNVEVQPVIKDVLEQALNMDRSVFIINDLDINDEECLSFLKNILGTDSFKLFDKSQVFVEGEEYPIYTLLKDYKEMKWVYFGGCNCINEKKSSGQYLRSDNSNITYMAVPSAEDILLLEFVNGHNVLSDNKKGVEELLCDLHALTVNDSKEEDRFISDELLETLYTEKYEAKSGSESSKLLIDRLTEIQDYEISEKSVEYNYWYRETAPSLEDLAQQRETEFDIKPLFSIVIPVFRTGEYYLRRLLDSIKNQTYANFEVCVADASDYSSYKDDVEPRQILEEYAQRDNRFKYKILDNNGGISANTNVAISMATGEYVVFADHDDELTQDALFECAKTINEYPMVQIMYSDEDKIDKTSEEFSDPHFKSDYNPEMLRCVNYFCHLLVVKRSLLDEVAEDGNGVTLYERPDFDGSQDYDLVLRCCEKAEEKDRELKDSYSDRYKSDLENGLFTSYAIRHIPKVLYHWRVYELSTAGGEEDVKPYTVIAGKKALAEHCKRKGIKNSGITDGISPGVYRINYEVDSPLVSVIIPNKDHTGDLDKAIRSIWNGSYKNVEFIVVENNSTNDETWKYYEKIQKEIPAVKVVYYKGNFNYSAINNFGVSNSSGEYLLFLNNDTEMYGTESLSELVALTQQDGIGAVGARLLYDDNSLQHAGIVVGIGGIAGNIFAAEEADRTYFNYAMFERDYSAATAAVLISSRKDYDMVGGFSEDLAVAFNDVDFCLKLRSKGLRVAYSPYAVFHHYESKSRGTDEAPEKMSRFHGEIVTFGEKWKDILIKGDPYYNRNLTLIEPDYGLKMLGRETIGKPCYNELLMDIVLTTEKM